MVQVPAAKCAGASRCSTVMLLRREDARAVPVTLDVAEFAGLKWRLSRTLPVGRTIVEGMRNIDNPTLCESIGHGSWIQCESLRSVHS